MRKPATSNGLKALAIAGTNVVLIGWDMSANQIRADKVLGFTIGRKRASDGESAGSRG